ncbi:MAG: DUF72 domain-containing protein [Prolixibacteraceae bacterium]|nr:DUF72 domain-containing protein [Prolixibacteraceae bacterium]
MKFGHLDQPELIDFTLPADHPANEKILRQCMGEKPLKVYVGCAKWNKQDLKNFYPRGTKDELAYYSRQFNSIELNATFYNMPKREQVVTWREKTPAEFKFFPKITQSISHLRRLNDVQLLVDEYCDSISNFEEKLGMVFLQMNSNFGFKNWERLVIFVENFPKSIPLAIELRHAEWFNIPAIASEVFQLFEKHAVTNVLVDTAGRRDLLHMRLTTPSVFIRYVGANDPLKDRERLDGWIDRLRVWVGLGLRDINFFVHQNIEMESPLLAAYFIGKLNKEFGLALKVPNLPDNGAQSHPLTQSGLTFDF